jgi:quinolinate synthase
MKMITTEKLLRALREDREPVEVPPEIAARARLAIERMVAIG